MTGLRGGLQGRGLRVAIVVARFNEFITKRLLESALDTLEQAGLSRRSLRVVWTPGALEVPYFCARLARSGHYDVLIALACVLRGGTYHFECVSNELTRGISQVALETGLPIATGIITANTLDDAIDRAGLKSGNKGRDAALAALEIAHLAKQMGPVKKIKQKRRK